MNQRTDFNNWRKNAARQCGQRSCASIFFDKKQSILSLRKMSRKYKFKDVTRRNNTRHMLCCILSPDNSIDIY
jgi:hypothetical protein